MSQGREFVHRGHRDGRSAAAIVGVFEAQQWVTGRVDVGAPNRPFDLFGGNRAIRAVVQRVHLNASALAHSPRLRS